MESTPEFWCNLCKRKLLAQPSFKGEAYYQWISSPHSDHNEVNLCGECWQTITNIFILGKPGFIKKIEEMAEWNSTSKAKAALAQIKQWVSEDLFGHDSTKRSSWELLMYEILRGMNINFTEQVKINGHKVDFAIPMTDKKSKNKENDLVIEVDGGWHKYPDAKVRDETVTTSLKANGYGVLRVTDEDLKDSVSRVKQEIMKAMTDPDNHLRKVKNANPELVS